MNLDWKMLLQLSLHPIEGKEVIIAETNHFKQFKIDSQLLSGFTHALQSISESKSPSIEHAGLTDLVIYLKKYENFTIRALLQNKVIDDLQVEESLSRITIAGLIPTQYGDLQYDCLLLSSAIQVKSRIFIPFG